MISLNSWYCKTTLMPSFRLSKPINLKHIPGAYKITGKRPLNCF